MKSNFLRSYALSNSHGKPLKFNAWYIFRFFFKKTNKTTNLWKIPSVTETKDKKSKLKEKSRKGDFRGFFCYRLLHLEMRGIDRSQGFQSISEVKGEKNGELKNEAIP